MAVVGCGANGYDGASRDAAAIARGRRDVGVTVDHASTVIIRANPAVVNGDPRSLTKTNGDVGLSRWTPAAPHRQP
jgi:hypothetical protein